MLPPPPIPERLDFHRPFHPRRSARQLDCFLVSEYQIGVPQVPRTWRPGRDADKRHIRVDAPVLDAFNLPRGHGEAKDEKDNLLAEMNKKIALGYPRTNILSQ